ncbi:MAG: HAD family phosphatase [Clostridia bacterium]|nr:HAD family phosphatase [Clostridia bacterium]MBR6563302.1 HAD family phosphatase [Clostridia bacterium]
MIKGAIFDLDGTLLDSMFIWDTIGEVYLRSLDIEPRENLAEAFKTFTLEESAEYYRTHYGVTLSVAEIVDGVNRMIEDLYKSTVPLKKGVAEFLAGLSKAGVRMCIATVTDKYLVEAALTRLKVRQYFGEIITTAEVGCGKNDPKIYRTALAYLGTEKHETLVFEDVLHALMTAKNDGFPVAAVYDKHELRQTEMKKNSDYYITNYETVKI